MLPAGEMWSVVTESPSMFSGTEEWRAIKVEASDTYDWQEDSTYIRLSPFFDVVTATGAVGVKVAPGNPMLLQIAACRTIGFDASCSRWRRQIPTTGRKIRPTFACRRSLTRWASSRCRWRMWRPVPPSGQSPPRSARYLSDRPARRRCPAPAAHGVRYLRLAGRFDLHSPVAVL
jgi:hypothetical protein